jgi:hypothetical protein
MTKLAVYLTALALAAYPSSSRAIDRFVRPHGKDTGNACTSAATPCRSVEQGVATASAGDVVHVAAGRYRTSLRVDASTSVTIEGGWNTFFTTRDPTLFPTVLRPRVRRYDVPGRRVSDRRVVLAVAEPGETIDLVFDGLAIEHGKAQSTEVGVPQLPVNFQVAGGGALWMYAAGGSVHVTLRGVTLDKNTSRVLGAGVALVLASWDGTADLLLDRSVVTGNSSDYANIWVASVGDTGIGGTAHVRIENTLIAMNRAEREPALYVEQYGPTSASADLVASTITDNLSRPESDYPNLGDAVGVYAGTVNLTDTLLWGNHRMPVWPGADLIVGASSTVNVAYSDVGDLVVLPGLGGVLNDLGGNLSVDPHLVNYELAAGSPLIDAGTCVGAPPMDLGGDPRPSGTTCDIGADEFVP